MARLDHAAVLGFFPDAADGRECGSLARRRRAAAQAGRDRSGKTLFRLGAAAPARQFRALSAPERSDRRGFRRPDAAGRVDAGLAGAATPPDIRAPQISRLEASLGYSRRDLWSGGADRARPPRRRTGLCPAEEVVLCRACRTEAVLRTPRFFNADRRSRDYRFSHFAEGPRQYGARPGQPPCMGGGAIWSLLTLTAELFDLSQR